jgi:hypothetical protein
MYFLVPSLQRRTSVWSCHLQFPKSWSLKLKNYPIEVKCYDLKKYVRYSSQRPIQVATRSKAWVCCRSLGGIGGSKPTGGMDAYILCAVSQVVVSTTLWSLVQRSLTECGVSECDREPSIMKRQWPPRHCCALGKKIVAQSAAKCG